MHGFRTRVLQVLGTVEDEVFPIGYLYFRTEGADPHASITIPIGALAAGITCTAEGPDVLEVLSDPRVMNEVVAAIVAMVDGFLMRHGAVLDLSLASKEVQGALPRAVADFRSRTPHTGAGWVVGRSRWGDILLSRATAEAWSQSWQLLNAKLSWAQLVDSLPEATRGIITSTIAHRLDPDGSGSISARDRRRWSELFDANGESWPWLASEVHQAWRWDIPEEVAERVGDLFEASSSSEGIYLSCTNVDLLIWRFAHFGYRIERDDVMIDQALGPFGTNGAHPPALDQDPDTRPRCPHCGTGRLTEILYGYPSDDAWDQISGGHIYHGGCGIYPDMPRARCNRCGFDLV